jgi:hypothetical protein
MALEVIEVVDLFMAAKAHERVGGSGFVLHFPRNVPPEVCWYGTRASATFPRTERRSAKGPDWTKGLPALA